MVVDLLKHTANIGSPVVWAYGVYLPCIVKIAMIETTGIRRHQSTSNHGGLLHQPVAAT